MTGERDCILAIDMGTSGPKVALVTTNGDVLAQDFAPTPVLLFAGGGAEQRPDDWWMAITATCRRLMAGGRARAEDVVAVSVTSQWSGTVAVDGGGNPLGNAIIWMDCRGAPHVERLIGGFPSIEGYGLAKVLRWIRWTGGAPARSGKDSLAHILYLRQDRPEIYRATAKFLEPKDWVNFRLTGKLAASFDSIALHWVTDNRDGNLVRYHPALLKMAGIERDKLPDLHAATDVLGPVLPDVATELGITPRAQVIVGTPDVHAAAIGSGAVGDFEAHLYVGTSSWIVCHVPFKKTDMFHNMASLPSAIPGRYILLNEQETAGECLDHLIDQVLFRGDPLTPNGAPEDAHRMLDELAAEVAAGSDGLVFTPWLYGERTPIEDHTVRGGYFNMSLRCDRRHMIRAVLEGVAYNSRWLLGHVERFIGRRIPSLRMIGGGARSALWCQIYADVLDRPIDQVDDSIAAGARGAAFLGAVALGRLRFADVAERVRVARRFTPDPAHRSVYDRLFHEFLEIYRRNRKAYARMNE